MPRPRKPRRVSSLPREYTFLPADGTDAFITMTVDEYEVIRLLDFEGFSQEECGSQMQIARTTVQLIYNSARRKLAHMLVNGLGLRIEGGEYELSSHTHSTQGGNIMKIAVTYENGQIFQHFGHTEQFKIYEIENGNILSAEVIDTHGSGHGALAGLLAEGGVDALICGGIGGGAQMALAQAGIRLFGGVSGSADDAVNALISGTLAFNPAVRCNHHGEGHTCGGHHDHGEGHSCGSHGCGGHGHHKCGHHE